MSRVIRVKPKQPSETEVITWDWGPLFDAGESFSTGNVSFSWIMDRESGEDVTAAMYVTGSLSTSSNTLSFRVQAGSDNRDYVAMVRVVSTKSRIENGEVIIPVRARVR